jgi:membrane protease YdiL (CAAX protease family)
VRRHSLFFFFLLAYAGSWIVYVPFILSSWGILEGDFMWGPIIRPFAGPTLAAIIMTYVTEGKTGLLDLRRRVKQKQAGREWYLFILIGVPALILLGLIVQPAVLASFQGLTSTLLVYYPAYFFIVFFGVAMPEEIGWRGFAYPRMQPRYGPLRGTLFLGVVWVFWHLPYFLTPDQGGGPGTGLDTFFTNFAMFFLFVMALNVIFTWVFNHTGGSVFMANLLHAAIDTPQLVWIPLFLAVDMTSLDLANVIAFVVPAVFVVVLTRGRLGYQPVHEQPVT